MDADAGTLVDLPMEFTSVKPYVRATSDRIGFIAASPTSAPSVMTYDLSTRNLDLLASPGSAVDERYISVPEHITYPTTGGERAHTLYYPPRNATTAAPADELPPLIIVPHAGPTTDAKPGRVPAALEK